MKYVFFGTPEFAAIILEKLIEVGFIPSAVVSNPDKPIGRKKILTPPPVKSLVMEHETWSIPVLQPEKLDKSFMFYVSSFMPDIFIVAAYSQILSRQILEIPRLGTIGVHPSLLPKYRGATPIQAAILNGDEKTGVSLFLIDEKMDNGPILSKKELEFSTRLPDGQARLPDGQVINYQFSDLLQKLAKLGADLLIETLPKYINGEINPLPQDESQAIYTKKIKTEDAFIKPEDLKKAQEIGGETALKTDRKIRALNPEPGTWTMRDGKRVKILEAVLIDEKLKITKIQVEGGKPQNVCGIV